jgi:hypothetical protein
MGSEIARDLSERYHDCLPKIAKVLNLDTSSDITLWRDIAWIELNRAVLHSFKEAKVAMVDHLTASKQFLVHQKREFSCGRETPAQWSWVVPPVSGSNCPLWHHEMRDFILKPQFAYQADVWDIKKSAWRGRTLTIEEEKKEEEPADAISQKVCILYGSETGNAEAFARYVAKAFKRFEPYLMSLNDGVEFLKSNLIKQNSQSLILLVITSTFGRYVLTKCNPIRRDKKE